MLPDLPLLSGQWAVSEFDVAINPATFVTAIESDSSRWYLAFAAGFGQPVQLTTRPDAFPDGGILFSGVGVLELKYKDWGPLIQQTWYARDRGGNTICTLFTASIRKRPIFNPEEV